MPKLKRQPTNKPSVNDKPAISTNNERPIFSLHKLNKDYCISKCEQDQKVAFANTLHSLSQHTWQDIILAARHGSGTEKIARSSIVTSTDSVPEDAEILAVRFWGKAPMVGYRDGRIFHIVWLDRNFTLYPH